MCIRDRDDDLLGRVVAAGDLENAEGIAADDGPRPEVVLAAPAANRALPPARPVARPHRPHCPHAIAGHVRFILDFDPQRGQPGAVDEGELLFQPVADGYPAVLQPPLRLQSAGQTARPEQRDQHQTQHGHQQRRPDAVGQEQRPGQQPGQPQEGQPPAHGQAGRRVAQQGAVGAVGPLVPKSWRRGDHGGIVPQAAPGVYIGGKREN